MKGKYAFLIVLTLFFISVNTFSQNQISGIIRDAKNGQPLQFVTVYFPDLKTGAVTNASGQYTIRNIPSGNYLIEISLISYNSIAKMADINGAETLNADLSQTSFVLNEVVLTGVPTAVMQRQNPVPVAILGKNELLQAASANLIDAISIIPGVSQITL